MDFVTEYRKRARDCIELANKIPDSASMLLSIAEAWTHSLKKLNVERTLKS